MAESYSATRSPFPTPLSVAFSRFHILVIANNASMSGWVRVKGACLLSLVLGFLQINVPRSGVAQLCPGLSCLM